MAGAGRGALRGAALLVGLSGYGVSMAMMVRAGLGLDPWDVFHQGLRVGHGREGIWRHRGVEGRVRRRIERRGAPGAWYPPPLPSASLRGLWKASPGFGELRARRDLAQPRQRQHEQDIRGDGDQSRHESTRFC